MGIPDKRYCFDHFQTETDIADILYAHYLNSNRHTLLTTLKECIGTHNWATRHWSNDHGQPLINKTSLSDLECYKTKLKLYFSTSHYMDSHNLKFTPESFVYLCNSLFRMGLIMFKIENVSCTQKNSLEFAAVLKK